MVCDIHYITQNHMQFTANLNGCKNGNFQTKSVDIFIIFCSKYIYL